MKRHRKKSRYLSGTSKTAPWRKWKREGEVIGGVTSYQPHCLTKDYRLATNSTNGPRVRGGNGEKGPKGV